MPTLTTAFLPANPSLQATHPCFASAAFLTPPYLPPTRPTSQSQRQFTIQRSASGRSKTHLPPQGGAPVSPLLWRSGQIPAMVKSQSLGYMPLLPVLQLQYPTHQPALFFQPALFGPFSFNGQGREALRGERGEMPVYKHSTKMVQTDCKVIQFFWGERGAVLERLYHVSGGEAYVQRSTDQQSSS